MDTEDNFYILLSSNVNDRLDNCDDDGDCMNAISHFINRLNRRVYLHGQWEVALTSIQFRKSWLNVTENQKLYLEGLGETFVLKDDFPAGNYIDPQEMIDKLNQLYSEIKDNRINYTPQFHYNKYSNTVSIKAGKRVNNDFLFPKLSEYLAAYLGLPKSDQEIKKILKILSESAANDYIVENETEKPLTTTVSTVTPSTTTVAPSTTTTSSVTTTTSSSAGMSDYDIFEADIQRHINEQRKTQRLAIESELKKKPPPIFQEEPPDHTSDLINEQSDSPVISVSNNFTYWHALEEVTLHGPTDTLYIYCSLVQPTLIATLKHPL